MALDIFSFPKKIASVTTARIAMACALAVMWAGAVACTDMDHESEDELFLSNEDGKSLEVLGEDSPTQSSALEMPRVPKCLRIGSKSEGWYWQDTEELIVWAQCAKATAPQCRHFFTRSEGWYSEDWTSYDGSEPVPGLIAYDFCHETVGTKISHEDNQEHFDLASNTPILVDLTSGSHGFSSISWLPKTVRFSEETIDYRGHNVLASHTRFNLVSKNNGKGFFSVEGEQGLCYRIESGDSPQTIRRKNLLNSFFCRKLSFQVSFEIKGEEKFCLVYQTGKHEFHAHNFSSYEDAKRHLETEELPFSNEDIYSHACNENIPPCMALYEPVCGTIKDELTVHAPQTFSNECAYRNEVRTIAGTKGFARSYFEKGACEKACVSFYSEDYNTFYAYNANSIEEAQALLDSQANGYQEPNIAEMSCAQQAQTMDCTLPPGLFPHHACGSVTDHNSIPPTTTYGWFNSSCTHKKSVYQAAGGEGNASGSRHAPEECNNDHE